MTTIRPHKVRLDRQPDGSMLYRTAYPLGSVVAHSGVWLDRWSSEAPDRVFVAERDGDGWREVSYAACRAQVDAIAASLLARGLGADTPILVMSGNSVDHALLALAAQAVGIPFAPIAEQYSLIPGAKSRLQHAIELIRPRAAFVDDAERFKTALEMPEFDSLQLFASRNVTATQRDITSMATLLAGNDGIDLDRAKAAVGPDTVVKILLTSGSTSHPKGVLTTQRMMCTNQTQITDAWPLIGERPPVILDWLPWNHVFGGSHNFNMMLANGGSLYIDEGKPLPSLFEKTLDNLARISATLSFNVPVGYSMLLAAMRNDHALRERFFGALDLVFYAGASLPKDVWKGLEDMALDVRGEIPLMTSSWGLTETAPAALMQHERTRESGIVGVPATGLDVKLLPDEDGRCEIRVRGPSVMPGYLDDPQKTAESFDDEGYFITGDAMVFVDPDDPSRGLRFDGRLSEDFKLLTGTWVRAAALRMDLLGQLAPWASDLVITGQDRQSIGVLIVANPRALAEASIEAENRDGALYDEQLIAALRERLSTIAGDEHHSSRRVTRALVLAETPSFADGEITAKGNINFRHLLKNRAALVERLYAATPDAACIVIGD